MIPWYLVLALIFLAVLVLDRDVLKNVDYCLLLTFISFFIFTGNMGRIPSIQSGLQQIVAGTVPVFILAGFIEGFATRHTEVPDALRLAFILLSLAFVIGYFVILPQIRHRQRKKNAKD